MILQGILGLTIVSANVAEMRKRAGKMLRLYVVYNIALAGVRKESAN